MRAQIFFTDLGISEYCRFSTSGTPPTQSPPLLHYKFSLREAAGERILEEIQGAKLELGPGLG